jgi:hypothetical protein
VPHASNSPLLHGFAQQWCKRKLSRLTAGEQGMSVNPDTTERQALASPGLMVKPVALQDEIPFRIMLRVGHHDQGGKIPFCDAE